MLNVALPKGRLADELFVLLEKAGYQGALSAKNSRKLVLEDPVSNIRYFLVKPSDAAVYVLHGAADIGVVGKDILLESEPDVYELLDLHLGICDMVVAGLRDFHPPENTLRVATKFPNIASKYYSDKGRDIELVALNGSVELAPIVGLSDVVVDITQTGSTLVANKMVILEKIMPISARLIANVSSYKFKADQIDRFKVALAGEVSE